MLRPDPYETFEEYARRYARAEALTLLNAAVRDLDKAALAAECAGDYTLAIAIRAMKERALRG